jgi:hypothetical protein
VFDAHNTVNVAFNRDWFGAAVSLGQFRNKQAVEQFADKLQWTEKVVCCDKPLVCLVATNTL